MLRGAGRGKVLAATQGRCQTVRGDGGHRVGDRDTGLLQLFMEVHDHGSLLLLGCVMVLLLLLVVLVVVRVMMVGSRVQ